MEGKEPMHNGKLLPQKGEVELLCGGPPCQGFSLAGNRYFGGYISVFRIYGRALTTYEVLQNYNALKGRFGL